MLEFLNIHRVVQATGMCKSKVYQEIRDGRFPKPIKLNPEGDPRSRSVWVSSEIEKWQKKVLNANRRLV